MELLMVRKFSHIASWIVAIIGLIVFYFSWLDGGSAKMFIFSKELSSIISWSHGGKEFFRLLIGLGGTSLGLVTGIYFIYFSKSRVQEPGVQKKSLVLGAGLFTLGLAAFLAFVLSVFPFYNFWIVLAAELTTISGLLLIYSAVSKEYGTISSL
ncbi:hypothetical protein HYT00_00405 [Candidatus Giovannonibacteria bacterium]|nr:hypothetical protein [Candidatus Giovannonibacteria bacterium]